MATAGKAVRRTTAQKHVDALLVRVKEVNAREDLAFKVDRVVLFGSQARQGDEPVGDVDVAVELAPVYPDRGQQFELEKERARHAVAEGRSFNTLVAELGFAQDEVWKLLKARYPVLSLHPISDLSVASEEVELYRRGA